jgi:hypothetical protein
MQTTTHRKTLTFVAVVGAAGSLAGCLCPTCINNPGGTTAAATTESTAAAAAPAESSAGAEAGPGSTVIWDGENAATGQSWASCDQEGKCAATLAIVEGEGKDGGIGLKLHGEGAGWQGGGWNWFGWYPENAGTDLTPYEELRFSVKITGESPTKLPSPNAINIAFGCSFEKKNSANAELGKFAANAADGKWHDVAIPLNVFFDGDGKECDPRTAWEIRFGSWSQNPVNFDLVVDNIVAAQR